MKKSIMPLIVRNLRNFCLIGAFGLGLMVMLCMVHGTSYADCQGCCSWHDGVCCIDGVTMCCDGTPLSQTCIDKGCDKCGDAGDSDAGESVDGDNCDGDVGCFITTVTYGVPTDLLSKVPLR